MKNIFYAGILVFIMGLVLTGCDVVESPFPPKRETPFIDTLALDSVEARTTFPQPVQKVLLEDYTGHTCGNCPEAAQVAHKLDSIHGERLVVMTVHAGNFAVPKTLTNNPDSAYIYDFRTPAGIAFNDAFEVSFYPAAIINRKKVSGMYGLHHSAWVNAVQTALQEAPKVGLNLTSIYRPSDRIVNVKASVKALSASTKNYAIGIYLVEDSIVNWQTDYRLKPGPTDVKNYTHRHILRTDLLGTWGEQLGSSSNNVKQGDTFSKYTGIRLNEEWNARHISIVAFVYDQATREIVQVEEQHLRLN